jgi:membrane-associated protease RseP (regulator of RpoE activity)
MVMATSSARSGLMVENITPQLGEFFGVKNGNGVLVRSVEKGSRAEKAGFRAGDVIVKVNEHAVHDTSDFAHGMKSRSGKSVNVGIMRDKKEQNLTLTLPERKESGDLYEDESFDWAPTIQADSALALSEIQSEMAQLRPQMELTIENARKMREDARKQLCQEQKAIRQQTRKEREQVRKNLEHLRQELQHRREEWL